MKEIIDLHMHTTVSDGSETPEELLQTVREKGIRIFAVTDHDAVKGYGILKDSVSEENLLLLSGVEFSCRDEKGKYHILGYGFDPEAESVRSVVEKGHSLRMGKVRARLAFLEKEYHFTFSEKDLDTLFGMENPGKPHIGNMMVKYGYAETKEKAITQYINKLHLRSEYIRPEEAIQAVLGGGGIPVLAHPVFGSGDELIMGEDMDRRLRRLIRYGLQGVEGFYSGYSPKMRSQMLAFADQYGLYVTAGSDYHGTNKLVEPGDTGLADVPVIPSGLKRFLADVKKTGSLKEIM